MLHFQRREIVKWESPDSSLVTDKGINGITMGKGSGLGKYYAMLNKIFPEEPKENSLLPLRGKKWYMIIKEGYLLQEWGRLCLDNERQGELVKKISQQRWSLTSKWKEGWYNNSSFNGLSASKKINSSEYECS